MIPHALALLGSFVVILAGSEMFTNGVEWAGHRLEVSEAAVGSLLAAVGTALPETFIPAVALMMRTRAAADAHQAVGVGAIIGAPLMLSTVALFVMGIAAILYRQRRPQVALRVSRQNARRDLGFFIPIFLVSILIGSGAPAAVTRHLLAAALLVLYGLYAFVMLRLERAEDSAVDHGLHLELALRGDPLSPRGFAIGVQVILGLAAILFGAREFVVQVVMLSRHAGVAPGIVSLLLSPLATELPEKYNSVIWIRQRKDHLALANITGAMVFQSCIPVAHWSGVHALASDAVRIACGLRSAWLGRNPVREPARR